MNIYIALFLFLASFLILIWGFRAGMMHNGRNKLNDAYFVMSLSTCVWAASLALMMITPREYCYVLAAVSVFGAMSFAVQIFLFMIAFKVDGTKYMYFRIITPLIGGLICLWRALDGGIELADTKYGTFYSSPFVLANVVYYLYIFLLAVGAIVILHSCAKKTSLRRERNCFKVWIGLIVLFAIGINGLCFFDMFYNRPTNFMEGVGGCSATILFYLIANYADMFELPKSKVESYITSYTTTPVVFVDYEGKITYHNDAFEKYFHLENQQITGTNIFYENIRVKDRPEKTSEMGSFHAVTVDGTRHMEVRYNTRYDRFGDILTTIYIINDTTEREKLLRDLEKQNILAEEHRLEAEHANQAKSDFLTHMSHEIRTPMNAIIGMNEMVMQEEISEKAAQYSQDIYNAGQTLLAIINDILDLSKIESGKMEIVPVTYELSDLLKDVLNLVTKKVQDKQLKLLTEIATDIPNQLYGDEVRIRQVILNVVNNAVKYTEKGSVTLKVDWEKTKEDIINLKIAVIDTGIGIREEDLKKLFRNFQRVDLLTNRNVEGTGLGLSITKQLTEQMNGRVYAESEYGKGSVFTIEIPQKVINFAPMGDFSGIYKKLHTNRKLDLQEFKAPEARMLIVDDNKVNVKVAKGLMKATEIQIDTAYSGQEALDKVKENSYHIILLDHMMPGMDGIETIRRMKEMEENQSRNAVIIAMTANAISGSKEKYLEAGFHDYLSKPIEIFRYTEMIRWYLPKELVHLVPKEEADKNA